MGWTVSVSWNAQNNSTDVDVASPPPEFVPSTDSDSTSSTERKLVPLDEWRRRVLPTSESEQPSVERDEN